MAGVMHEAGLQEKHTLDVYISTDRQTMAAPCDSGDSRPTPDSIAAAKECQAHERAAFTRLTGVPLREDGTADRRFMLKDGRLHN